MASIDLISKKTNCTCSTLFFLISKTTKFARVARFSSALPLFCTTTTLSCRTKLSNFLVAHYFYGGILTQYFVSYVDVRFYFSLPIIFTLLATSISHCLTAALNFHVFLPTKFFSFVLRNQLQLSFSVIHMSVNIKNNVEKDTTLLLFFLSKNPGGHAISFQIKP